MEGVLTRIGELASRVGVSVRAPRSYEEQDLLASARSTGGQRQYPDSAVDRVQLIQQLYSAGLPSRATLELLPCVGTGDVTPVLLDRLSAERDRIDAQVSTLVKTRDWFDAIITTASTARSAGRPCPR
ncbi:MerR family transcriptional regulator [Streptomyces sp. MBT65]|uniref:MerR family transcriptional regulator n=1 Tax=Streptomyces sp. MBT65 TaxID=1488395 RepID=UPI00190A5908|nr:MerR family transcriptional regulator [Streptomyces sp. MBT65]MBK3579862.1 MerR family transcriptional regulator [Streptomyces sp. MBT65]